MPQWGDEVQSAQAAPLREWWISGVWPSQPGWARKEIEGSRETMTTSSAQVW